MTRRAPNGLAAAGKRVWAAFAAASLTDAQVVILEEAARTADELHEMQVTMRDAPVAESGSRGQVIAHPLLSAARLHRLALIRPLDALTTPAAAPAETGEETALDRLRRRHLARRFGAALHAVDDAVEE